MSTRTTGLAALESAILFGVVVAALVVGAVYHQRGLQGGLKSSADSLGIQFSTTQGWRNTVHSVTTQTVQEGAPASRATQTVDYEQTLK